MMYDFDRIVDRRNTNAVNVEACKGQLSKEAAAELPWAEEDIIRMWVADMEFAVAPEILQAVRARVDREIFGYTNVFDGKVYEAFLTWCREHYGWAPEREELCLSPGLVPALYLLLENLCTKDDKVVLHTPAYGCFLHAAEYSDIEALCSPLYRDESGVFRVDFADMERRCADPACKAIIWCNPHNPTGRVWTREELEQVAALAVKHDLWLISDEIHCDLTRCGISHMPMAKILPDYPKLITLMAPSKTFNLAGMAFSFVIIRDEQTRERFVDRDKVSGLVNPLSLAAVEAAYTRGHRWHQELRAYLDGNFALLKEKLGKIPGVRVSDTEATYLAWVDFSQCLPEVEDLTEFFALRAGVIPEGGERNFVGNCKGFLRMNIAMARPVLEKGLDRMCQAIEAYKER